MKIRVKVGDVEIEVDDGEKQSSDGKLANDTDTTWRREYRKTALDSISQIADKAAALNSEQYR